MVIQKCLRKQNTFNFFHHLCFCENEFISSVVAGRIGRRGEKSKSEDYVFEEGNGWIVSSGIRQPGFEPEDCCLPSVGRGPVCKPLKPSTLHL